MTFHLGIIGGGNISETHLRAARAVSSVAVSAVYGENANKVRALSEMCGASAYTDFNRFLDHQPLDFVLIGSPSGLHAAQGITAARRGLHVLSEKPLDTSVARASELVSVCESLNVKLGVFFQDRVKPDLNKLREFICAGKLGRIIIVSARVKWFRLPEYYRASRWRGTWELDGGGAVMNQCIHTLDLLLWLLGDVKSVSARTRTMLHQIETEDTAVAILEFASGALGTFEAATSVYPGYNRRIEITGENGTIIVEHDRVVAADLRDATDAFAETSESDNSESATSATVSDASGHKRIIEDFLRAITTNSEPVCSGREGLRSVEFAAAIYESAQTGQAVQLTLNDV